MALTAEQQAERLKGIGGSEAGTIMGDDEQKLLDLWMVKRRMKEPENLDDVLPVQIGNWTEEPHTNWFERKTGLKVVHRQLSVTSKEHPFMRATLDGVIDVPGADLSECPVFDTKHVNQFTKKDEPARKYFWQFQHNMLCTGATNGYLSVIYGTLDWEYYIIEADPLAQAQLIAAERAFWACVETGDPPVVINVPAPVEAVRKVDMTGDNEFASAANIWLSNKVYAQSFEKAAKELKGKVPADAKEAFGYGVSISRSTNGSLTIREAKI